MQHFRLLVELYSYTMTAKITNYRKAIALGMALYYMTYITQKSKRLSGLHSLFQTLFSNTYQLFFF